MTDNWTTELLQDLLLELMDEYYTDDFTPQTKFAKKYAERIEQVIAATLGSRMCEFVDDSDNEPSPPKCSVCGYDPGIYECAWYEDGTYGYERSYCPNCGAKIVS